MFFELVATFAAGISAAGLALIANHLTGGRLPRWFLPVAAGAAMLGYTVWSEYTWGQRTRAALPDGVEVLMTVEESRIWKPWTYLAPQTTRIMALDRRGVQSKPEAPGIVLADLYLFQRWTPPAKRPQLVDCAEGRRADVSAEALADPSQAAWRSAGPDDPLMEALCRS